MAKKSTKQDPIKTTLFAEMFPRAPSKADMRRMEILSGAIQAYSKVGYNSVSYDDVAEPAKTSRALVQHYFPSKDELFETSMKLIRAEMQQIAVQSLSNAKTPQEKFKEYVHSTFTWATQRTEHAQAWFLFFVVCSQDEKWRQVHADLTSMGERRIVAMMKDMGIANVPEKEFSHRAKTIQRLITGGIIELRSEQPLAKAREIRDSVLRACLHAALAD